MYQEWEEHGEHERALLACCPHRASVPMLTGSPIGRRLPLDGRVSPGMDRRSFPFRTIVFGHRRILRVPPTGALICFRPKDRGISHETILQNAGPFVHGRNTGTEDRWKER